MTTAGDVAGPAQHQLDEATCTARTATHQSVQSAQNGTPVPVILASPTVTAECPDEPPEVVAPEWPPRRDWSGEREVIATALALTVGPAAAVEDVPAFGTPEWGAASPSARVLAVLVHLLEVHDRCARAEWVCWDRARQDEDARLTALREASHAISAAVDWSAASRRPSHAELERRRAVVVMPS